MNATHAPHEAFLTCRQLAARLAVQPETVRRWARDGAIPAIRIRPKVIRFDMAAVRAALAERPAREGVANA